MPSAQKKKPPFWAASFFVSGVIRMFVPLEKQNAMALNKGKHVVTEIEGIRSTVIETGLNENRCLFLKELLQKNGYEVKMEKEKAKDGTQLETWILGVTDLIFNPMIRVYEQKILRPDSHPVTPAYWNQWAVDPDLPYWMVIK